MEVTMKAVIIYAHPDTEGHNKQILAAVTKKLYDKAIEFDVIDLYKAQYDPVLHENELYTIGNKEIASDNQKYQQQIKSADLVVLIYPVWAFSMPAILNGFLSRVFTPGFAVKEGAKLPVGLLHQKAIVFMTTGAPTLYYKLIGNTPKKVIKSCLKYTGMQPSIFQLGGCDKVTSKTIAKINKLVNKAFECGCMHN
jgi:NAD(P)H dehydrogenase (quinone)